MIFVNSYFYRRIVSTRGELPVCGIHNQSNSLILSFRDGYHFKEFNHGSIQSFIISEKKILFLAASSFGIPDPLFGLYDVYIYHQVFI